MRFLLVALLAAGLGAPCPARPPAGFRAVPVEVTVRGYRGDLMEPFLSPDGRFLLFNNLNDPSVNTELHWAHRVSDEFFDYGGKLAGANGAGLEGVPSLDEAGNLYFISPRSYARALSTVHRAQFRDGVATGVERVEGLPTGARLIFDAEVSRDGRQLVLSEGLLTGGPVPQAADLRSAHLSGPGFAWDQVDLFRAINRPDTLEYAAALSGDRLHLYFTRLENGVPAIFRSRRGQVTDAFEPPERIYGLQTLVEAPAFSADQAKIYYHARVAAGYRLFYFRP